MWFHGVPDSLAAPSTGGYRPVPINGRINAGIQQLHFDEAIAVAVAIYFVDRGKAVVGRTGGLGLGYREGSEEKNGKTKPAYQTRCESGGRQNVAA